MSSSVVDTIFKEFKFRTLSKTSSKNQIYKSIVNTAFKANILCSIRNEDGNVSYYINEELVEWLEPLYDLCKNYRRVKVDRIPLFLEEQIECLEDE
jgi:hypothetical protein